MLGSHYVSAPDSALYVYFRHVWGRLAILSHVNFGLLPFLGIEANRAGIAAKCLRKPYTKMNKEWLEAMARIWQFVRAVGWEYSF